MLATASGRLHCKGLPLPPNGHCKENLQEFHGNARLWDDRYDGYDGYVGYEGYNGYEGHGVDYAAFDVSPPRHREARLEAQTTPESIFEARVRDAREDAVHAWCEYVQWTAENRQSKDELSVLARACYALAGDATYRDDIRHLRLWVRHAAHISEAEKVFEFLAIEGIGLGHALLYEAWASHLERQRKFADAEHKYKLGLRREAEPHERLQSRYQEFQRRMCKRAARGKGPKATESRSSRRSREEPAATAPMLQPCVSPAEAFAVHEDTALQTGADEEEVELPVHDQVFIPIPVRNLVEEVQLPAVQTLLPCTTSCAEEAPLGTAAPPPRVLARIGGSVAWQAPRTVAATAPHRSSVRSSQASERSESRASLHSGNATSELTSGLRNLLADADVGRRSRRSSCELFDDPTYTAELAQREILALFATDSEPSLPVSNVPQPRAPLLRHLGSGGSAGAGALGHSRRGSGGSPRTSGAFEIFEETDFSIGR